MWTTKLNRGVSKGMLVAVLGIAAILGGCSGNKKQSDLAMQESAELREQNASLTQNARDKDARIAELEEKLANCAPAGVAQQPAPATNWQAPVTAYPAATNYDGGGQDFVQKPNGDLVATLAGNVLFDSGKTTIKDGAKKQLDRIAREIKTKHRGASIRVEGHTDSDPIKRSKWGSNDALSQARADEVKKYLAKAGVPSSTIDSMGYGSSQPKKTKAESRRVEIVIAK